MRKEGQNGSKKIIGIVIIFLHVIILSFQYWF